MFGFVLGWDEWAAVIGAGILLGRLLYLVGLVFYRLATDTDTRRVPTPLGTMAGGLSGALLAVACVARVAGGVVRGGGDVIYAAAAPLGFFLGLIVEMAVELRLVQLTERLRTRYLPWYRERLADPDPEVRRLAVRRLMLMGPRNAPAVPDLLDAAKDGEAEVRCYALLALATGGDTDPRAQAAARTGMADRDPKVRAAGAVLLTNFNPPPGDVLPALCDGLRQDGHQVAVSSVEALTRLGPAAEPALPVIRELVLNPEPPADGPAFGLLISVFPALGPAGVPVLVEVLEQGSVQLKPYALHVLGNMGEAARPALPVIRRLASGGGTIITWNAKQAIKKIGDVG